MHASEETAGIAKDSQHHYQWLDAMRGIAAMLVVLTHARGFLLLEYGELRADSRTVLVAAFYAITRLGHEAVIVFFVLSGYLVGGKAFERMGKREFRENTYLVDRVARIWVPLVPALIISALLNTDPSRIGISLGNLIGLQGVTVPVLGGNAPLWSLAYEIWFYVLAYAIGRQAMRSNLDIMAWCLIVFVVLVFTKLKIEYLACWLIGAVAYLRPHRMTIKRGVIASGALALASIAGLQLTRQGFMGVDGLPPVLRTGFELLLGISTGLACVSLVRLKPSRLSKALIPLAGFSYTLYLVHFPLLSLLPRYGWARVESVGLFEVFIYFISVGGVTLLAWCLYLAFERNTELVKVWIYKQVSKRFLPDMP